MSTNSTIAMEYPDGSIRQIYCHWDGYLEHNGRLLRDHWTIPDKIDQLLSLGNLSYLGKEIGNKQNFSKPSIDWCLAYGRDRGDINETAGVFNTLKDYLDGRSRLEFDYIFKSGEWYVSENGGEFMTLELAFELQNK